MTATVEDGVVGQQCALVSDHPGGHRLAWAVSDTEPNHAPRKRSANRLRLLSHPSRQVAEVHGENHDQPEREGQLIQSVPSVAGSQPDSVQSMRDWALLLCGMCN